ncbi:MAG: hypothetical protein JW913_00805 [Chitinispirillaceae bacterium]|nr:hypothetical protein [Chitinispirillaceae bacterium]
MDSNSSMIPSIAYTEAPMERGIAAGRDGNCFHAVFTIMEYGWFAFGCDLLDTGKGYDLNGFDRITFDARGSGSIMVEIRSAVEKRRGKDFWSPMLSEPVTLTEKWTTVTMERNSFSLYSDKLIAERVSSEQFLDEVTNLQFRNTIPAQAANETVDLWIDNIRLWGVPPEVFYPVE